MIEIANLPSSVVRYAVGAWRRRWTAFWVMFGTAITLWAALWLIPDRYEARGQIFVQTETILQPVTRDMTARPDYERRVEVMQRALLTRQNLEKIIFRSGIDSVIDATSPRDRLLAVDDMIDRLADDIKINSPREMYFDIRYGFSEPQLSSAVVDAVLDLFIEQDLGASLQENKDAKRKLETEIERFEARLAAKDQEVARFRRENAEELALVAGNQRRREQLEADISRLGDAIATGVRRAASLRSTLSSTRRSASASELDKLRLQLAELRSQFEEEYPDIKVVKSRIAELEAGAARRPANNPEYIRIRSEVAAATSEIEALQDREKRLQGELAALTVSMAQAPAVEAELQRIVRDYEQTQRSYEELVQSRDRLDLTTVLGPGAQGVDYRILERPRPALKPSSPPRLLLILGSIVIAFAAGLAATVGLTYLDRSFTQVDALKAAIDLPVLGGVSISPSKQSRALFRADMRRMATGAATLGAIAIAYAYVEVIRGPDYITTVAQDLEVNESSAQGLGENNSLTGAPPSTPSENADGSSREEVEPAAPNEEDESDGRH
ncbi:MAG: hypothetical protein AAF850_00905 [Pseudomonadota bacterium]